MTRPTNLFYEMYVFNYYQQVLVYIQDSMNHVSTLEEDLELLREAPGKKPIDWTFRMAVVYRSEKKKILRSQLNMIKKVNSVLEKVEETLTKKGLDQGQQSRAFTELLLEETDMEVLWRQEVHDNKDLSKEEKQKKLEKLEYHYYHRRLMNADYFKMLKALILTYDYI